MMPLLWFMAFLPIALLFHLMVIRRVNTIAASSASLALAAVSAFFFFKAPLFTIAVEAGKGVWSSLTVLYVVWTAILFYELCDRLNLFAAARGLIHRLSGNELLNVLFVACGVTSFFQGITGFGVPIVIGAPLLVSLGVRPVWAVIFCIMGHTWGATYGTLALAWNTLILQSGLTQAQEIALTGLYASLFLWVFIALSGLMICWWYGRWRGLRAGLPAVLLIALIQGGGETLFSQLSPDLAAFIPALTAPAALWLLGRTPWYARPWRLEASPVMERAAAAPQQEGSPASLLAALPYAVLTALALLAVLAEPVHKLLSQVFFSLAMPATGTGLGFASPASAAYSPIYPLAHAGAYLGVTCLLTAALFRGMGRMNKGDAAVVLRRTARKACPVSLGIICLLVMANVLGGTGQIHVLAQGTAACLAGFYALLAPFVGMLGSFITGSNVASNILFTEFQMRSADLLGFSTALMLAGQTVGGAIGCTVSPSNILLGAAAMGVKGQEGRILSRLLPITLFCTLLAGLTLYLLT